MNFLHFFSLIVIFCFYSIDDQEIKEIPSLYIDPKVKEIFYDYPLIIENGYIVLENENRAKGIFNPLPPEVDFEKQNVIIFAWKGSGQDKIDYEYNKENKTYNFVYKRGLTKDYREHIMIVSIGKENKWLFHRVLD